MVFQNKSSICGYNQLRLCLHLFLDLPASSRMLNALNCMCERQESNKNWWHFRFLKELPKNPPAPHPPHSSLHPQFQKQAFTLLLPDDSGWSRWGTFSTAALGTGFSSSQGNSGRAMTDLSAFPTAQPVSGCFQCLPSDCSRGWLSVCLRAKLGHCHGLSKGGKGAAELWVAAGSACTSHTPAWSDPSPVLPPHSPTAPGPRELPASLEIKTHPLPAAHIQHQRHSHSRAGFCEPFINTVHSFGAQNYSLSSLLSYSSQGLIINGPVKQYTACCILIQYSVMTNLEKLF